VSGTLLIVDDDAPFRAALAAAFTRRAWSVSTASSPAEALALATVVRFTHAVLDLRMPGGSGLDLLVLNQFIIRK
jgi:ActR/RegA family two-component response regulator